MAKPKTGKGIKTPTPKIGGSKGIMSNLAGPQPVKFATPSKGIPTAPPIKSVITGKSLEKVGPKIPVKVSVSKVKTGGK